MSGSAVNRLLACAQAGGCAGMPTAGDRHAEMDSFGKANGMTVVFAPWHQQPEYRVFKTGTLSSRNEEFPSGLVIVDERGAPRPWPPHNAFPLT